MLTIQNSNYYSKMNFRHPVKTNKVKTNRSVSMPVAFQGSKPPREIENFLKSFENIFGGLEFRRKEGRFLSNIIGYDEANRVSAKYQEVVREALFDIIEKAEPTESGVTKFLGKLLDHKAEYPFRARREHLKVCLQPPSSVLAGDLSIHATRNAQIIKEANPDLAAFISEKGLSGNTLWHKAKPYFVKPRMDGFGNNILIGIDHVPLKNIN